MEALTTVKDYDITLEMDGRLSDFTFELTSYPPLTHEENLILLVMGRTPDEQADKSGSVVGAEMAEVLRTAIDSVELEAVRPETDPVVLRGITLAPRYGTEVRVSRRLA